MPGHYVPGGGVSRTAHKCGAMPCTDTGHGASKMAEFIRRAELPLICFLRATMVLIKGVKKLKKTGQKKEKESFFFSFLHYCLS